MGHSAQATAPRARDPRRDRVKRCARRTARPRNLFRSHRNNQARRDMQTETCFRGFKTIVVKGSPLYQSSVVEQLEKLWKTWTGWAVLRGIIDTGKTLTIVPYSAEDEKKLGRENAFAHAKSARAASPAGFWPYRGKDDPKTPKDERFDTIPFFKGWGGGSDDEVHFSVDT